MLNNTFKDTLSANDTDLQDGLDNSFSNLEEEEDGSIEDTVNVIIEPEQVQEDVSDSAARLVQMTDTIQEKGRREINKPKRSNTSEIEILEEKTKSETQTSPIRSMQEYQFYEKKYIEKMRVLYGLSIINSECIGGANLKKLKTFLYVPTLAQELVNWGNIRYGSSHTVTSALQRLDLIQESECAHTWSTTKQHLKWIGLLFLGMILVRMVL